MRISDWSSDVCSSDLFVPSTTARKAIGSLVLGYHRGGKLIHAGRVGTGFTQKVAAALFKRLDKMKQTKSPFAKKLTAEAERQVVFVRPELVAEVEFRASTADSSDARRVGKERVSTGRSRW